MKKPVRLLSIILCFVLSLGIITPSFTAHAAKITSSYSGKICYDNPLHLYYTIENPGSVDYYLVAIYKDTDCTQWLTTSSKLYYTSGNSFDVVFDLATKINLNENSECNVFYAAKLFAYNSKGSVIWTSTRELPLDTCTLGYWSGWNEMYTHGTFFGINYAVDGVIVQTQKFKNICSGTETLLSYVPTKTGYTFSGWSTSDYSGPVTHSPGGSIFHDHMYKVLYAVWKANTYSVKYNGNGATSGSMSNQTFTYDSAQNLNANSYSRKYTVTYNYNGATGGNTSTSNTATATFNGWATSSSGSKVYNNQQSVKNLATGNGATVNLYANWSLGKVTLPSPTRTNYTFDGWYKDSSYASFAGNGGASYTPSSNTTLYAKWTAIPANLSSISVKTMPAKTTYMVGDSFDQSGLTLTANYSDNSTRTITSGFTCSGFSSETTGTKTITVDYEGKTTTFTVEVMPKIYTLTYDANGGSDAPSKQTGSGNIKLSDTKPIRNGYNFLGWATSAGATTAQYQPGADFNLTKNTTLYAVWTSINIYNLGEETYSFGNYGDADSRGGHCFGMSISSAGYYTGDLNTSVIGIDSAQKLYTLSGTQKVKEPICHYQAIQGSFSLAATVAGGTYYKTYSYNISADWNEVVNYVKNHQYDDEGMLQIGYRKDSEGGHAINFLRYSEVNGQPRIYAYDNNYPNIETYFYKGTDGRIYQAPQATFSGAIDCIALRDVNKYYSIAGRFDATHVIYAEKDTISIIGVTSYPIDGGIEIGEYVMYEIPMDQKQVTIIPLIDQADFVYMDETYRFNNSLNDGSVGTFTLATLDDGALMSKPTLTIVKDTNRIRSISVDDITMYFKESTTIKPKVDAEAGTKYTVKYESLNPSVATVDGNGNVYAAKRGTTEIKVTVTDNSGKSVTDTCKVTVKYTFIQWIMLIFLFGWIWMR